jgi:hypothetical protein
MTSMSFTQLQIFLGPSRLLIRKKVAPTSISDTRGSFAKYLPLAITPCAVACFKVAIDHYIFRPASAKKVPIVWRGKSYYQHTTNVVQLRQQSEKTQNLSSFHEKNNEYLGLSKRSFMPQL